MFVTDDLNAINKGDAKLFKIEASVTEPMGELELGIMQPLGYNVM
jgi:hypothetical protein